MKKNKRICEKDRFAISDCKVTMKAVVTTGNGGYEKLDYRDVPVPKLGSNEVLLQVLAAGINNTEIRVITIPIEDFVYGFSLISMNIFLYELIKHKSFTLLFK